MAARRLFPGQCMALALVSTLQLAAVMIASGFVAAPAGAQPILLERLKAAVTDHARERRMADELVGSLVYGDPIWLNRESGP